MKGLSWTSPRGPVSIDPETRDIIQNIYIRKVEKVNGELFNVEFATIAERQGSGEGRQGPVSRTSATGRRPHGGAPLQRRTRAGGLRCMTILFDGIAYGMLLFVLALRAVGDAGADELRQPRAWRLRHGGRLCHRRPDEPLRRAVPAVPAAGLHRGRAASARCWNARCTATSTTATISTRCCSPSASSSCPWRRWTTRMGSQQQLINAAALAAGPHRAARRQHRRLPAVHHRRLRRAHGACCRSS